MQESPVKNMKEFILFFGALIFFMVATFFSFYEGSRLDDDSWEWPYSAIFTNWLNGGVESAADILTIDYLVYAAKFAPLFPVIMFVSAFILLLQLSSRIFRNNNTALSLFHIACAVALFVMSGVLMSSPTVGLQYFSQVFFIIGVVLVIFGATSLIKARKQQG